MNILLLCCDIRSDVLSCFQSAIRSEGTLLVAGTDPWCSTLYEAQQWYLFPPLSEPAYMEQVLDICRNHAVNCIIPLHPQICSLMAAHRDDLTRDGITLIDSDASIQATFPDKPDLLIAWQDCFSTKQPSILRRTYRSVARLLPLEFREWLHLRPDYLTTYQKNKRIIRSSRSRIVYLLDAPTHDNLGDHAIAYAQQKFIEQTLPDARILEIPVQLVPMHLPLIRKHIRPDDLFCMIGGGNFGDEYLMHEHTKREVCRLFPDNRVIIFPQTISYSDTPRGRRELELTRQALNCSRHLTITARDKVSHRRAQDWFPDAACILTPDIVLTLAPVTVDAPRKGILCCLRRDQERNESICASDVANALAREQYAFSLSDTIASHGVSIRQRPQELEAKWREFQGAELVITDRLHGMIFSCITSTPCVVIDNYNHKIRNFYQTWLKDVSSIRFAEKAEEILPLTRELLAQGRIPWDPAGLAEYYAPLREALRKEDSV